MHIRPAMNPRMKPMPIKISAFVASAMASVMITGCAAESTEDEVSESEDALQQMPQSCKGNVFPGAGAEARVTAVGVAKGRLKSLTYEVRNPMGNGNKIRVYINDKKVGSGNEIDSHVSYALGGMDAPIKKGDRLNISFSFNEKGPDSKCVIKLKY